MRHIAKFLFNCLFTIFYAFIFALIFTSNSILFLPFAFVLVILGIILGAVCTPFAIMLIIGWIMSMIANSVLKAWNYAKNLVKSWTFTKFLLFFKCESKNLAIWIKTN